MRHDQRDRTEPPFGLTSTRSEWVLLDAILEKRRRKQDGGTARSENEEVTAENTHRQGNVEEESSPFSWEGWDGAARRLAGEEGGQDPADIAGDAVDGVFGGDAIHIPTLSEVLDALKDEPWKAPTAFRSAASLCGQLDSPFDSIIPFERLQVCAVTRVRQGCRMDATISRFPTFLFLLLLFFEGRSGHPVARSPLSFVPPRQL